MAAREQDTLDVVVVGAGHAGLAASYFLKKEGLSHIVFERGRIGESWRSQRWNSFTLNTPNSFSHLPGDDYSGDDPEGFYPADVFVSTLERYRARFGLPVETGVEVVSVALTEEGFLLSVRKDSSPVESVRAHSVIAASGIQNVPRIPELAAGVPSSILQLHAADYRNPEQLPSGSVLVVGGGQSGFQISEDLLESGRTVFFSSSKVARVPRRYRGRDIIEWMRDVGLLGMKRSDVTDPSMITQTIPHVSGVGPRGRTVSYQHLARNGATIVGRVTGFQNGRFTFADDAGENVRFADQESANVKKGIDEFLRLTGQSAPPLEDDPIDSPDPEAACASSLNEIDAREADIRSVIWCTGFRGIFDWIDAPVLDVSGRPDHVDGISAIPGLYFVGFPWLRTRKSGIISGSGDDAEYVVSQIIARKRN